MFRFHFKTNRDSPIGLILAIVAIWIILALVSLVPMIKHILWCISHYLADRRIDHSASGLGTRCQYSLGVWRLDFLMIAKW
ncbi:MAG: hypothetical protein OXF95_11085 [Rhodobacteraceae bacterium]|nr:hypothetical protein [Paracoccaceae bacterium]